MPSQSDLNYPALAKYLGLDDLSDDDIELLQTAWSDAGDILYEEIYDDCPASIAIRAQTMLAARLYMRRFSPLGMIDAGEFGWNVRAIDVDYERIIARWKVLTWA